MARKIQSVLWAAACLAAGIAQGGTLTRTSAFEYDAVSGLLTKEIVEPGDSNLCLVTVYAYDGFGNRTSATTRNCNGSVGSVPGTNSEAAAPTGDAVIASRTTTTTYDAGGRYPTGAANALGHAESRTFDPRFGTVLTVTGPNGLTTSWQYDDYGRKVLETRPDGTRTQWAYGWYHSGFTVGGDPSAYYVTETPLAADGVTQNGPLATTYYDYLDRPIRGETQGFDGSGSAGVIRQDTQYDSLGRPYMKSRPYYMGQTAYWTTTTYDALGRPIQVAEPDNATTTTAYNGLTVTVTNAKGQTRTTVKNSQGQVVSVRDAQNNLLTYAYDPFGNLVRTTDPLGNVTTLAYDLRGRKTQMADPDMGTWTYAYDALGQLIKQTDAKAQQGTMAYDRLGRLTQRSEADLVSNWYYDTGKAGAACPKGIGKLCQAETSTGYGRTHSYDALGRPDTTTTSIDIAYATTVAYDAHGRVATRSYPSGLTLKYAYTALGYLKEVRDNGTDALYWRADAMDAGGRITAQTQGNGVATTQTFQPENGRLLAILAGAGNGVQNLAYTYDSIGNVTSRADANQSLAETFGYDSLNRLTASTVNSGGAGIVGKTYAYNAIGNIASRSDLGSYTYPASGGGSVRPHAVSRVDLTGGGYRTYAYDGDGNIAAEVQYNGAGVAVGWRNGVYSSFNMPQVVYNAAYSSSFYYGPEHQRVKQVSTAASGTTIYAHPGNNGDLLYEKDLRTDGSVEQRSFITAGGQVVALVKQVTTAGGTTTQVRYLHRDKLGSTTAVTDESGAVVERLAYEPFGKRRFPVGSDDPGNTIVAATTDRGFTNHEHMDELGLVHMNGRIYDPVIGRFVSADPNIQAPYNLQSYNRYTYGFNSPLSGIDPSGYGLLEDAWESIGRVFDGLSDNPRALFGLGVSIWLGFGDFSWLDLGKTGIFGKSIETAVTAGFAGGAISSGKLQGGLQGAFSAGLFYGVGTAFPVDEERFLNVLGHAAVGCVTASAAGGDCERGAMAASAGAAWTNYGPKFANPVADFVATSAVGGTISVIGGGKFANGASTAAFGYLFNQAAHGKPPYETRELAPQAEALGIETTRLTETDFQSVQGKHGPMTNRGDRPNSIFDPDLIRNYETFVDKVVNPALGPGAAPLTVSASGSAGQIYWDRTLPYSVGTSMTGVPTNTVRLVLKYDWGLSLSQFSSIWRITGAYPK